MEEALISVSLVTAGQRKDEALSMRKGPPSRQTSPAVLGFWGFLISSVGSFEWPLVREKDLTF